MFSFNQKQCSKSEWASELAKLVRLCVTLYLICNISTLRRDSNVCVCVRTFVPFSFHFCSFRVNLFFFYLRYFFGVYFTNSQIHTVKYNGMFIHLRSIFVSFSSLSFRKCGNSDLYSSSQVIISRSSSRFEAFLFLFHANLSISLTLNIPVCFIFLMNICILATKSALYHFIII